MRTVCLTITLLAASAAAQRTFTSPLNYDRNEGPDYTTLYVPWYDTNGGRYQWTDGGQRNQVRPNVNKLELRRDGLIAFNAAWGPRSTTVTVVMGYCDASALTLNFASNYAGTPTTCVNQMPLNLPDHTTPPAAPPAPWSIAIPFTTPFSYVGTPDLLWELVCENTSAGGGYCLDAHPGGAGTSSYIGNGCNNFGIWKIGPTPLPLNRLRLGMYADNGPLSQPAVLVFGLTDPNTDFGGLLCTNLRASLDITLPFATDNGGFIASAANPITIDLPAPFSTATVFTQFVALDPASTLPIPVRLTDAVSWTLSTSPVPVSLLWYDGPNPAMAAAGARRGASAIARFTY